MSDFFSPFFKALSGIDVTKADSLSFVRSLVQLIYMQLCLFSPSPSFYLIPFLSNPPFWLQTWEIRNTVCLPSMHTWAYVTHLHFFPRRQTWIILPSALQLITFLFPFTRISARGPCRSFYPSFLLVSLVFLMSQATQHFHLLVLVVGGGRKKSAFEREKARAAVHE